MPFSSISLPSIAGWGSKPRTADSFGRSVDLSTVSDAFGIPDVDDPDPFGVHALEEAGLEIKEAGTQSRPTSETFEFKPSPTSPLFRHSFQSLDGVSRHGSVGRESVLRDPRRDSKRSMVSVDQGTQTVDLPGPPPLASPPMSPKIIESKATYSSPLRKSFDLPLTIRENSNSSKEDLEPTLQDRIESSASAGNEENLEDVEEFDSADEEDDDFSDVEPLEIIEEAEPTVQIVAQKISSPAVTRAKIVNIPRRAPPAIPVKNPRRRRVRGTSEDGDDISNSEQQDDSGTSHPTSPAQINLATEKDISQNASCKQTPPLEVTTASHQDLDQIPSAIKLDSDVHLGRGASLAERDHSSDEASTPTADPQNDGGSLRLDNVLETPALESQPLQNEGLCIEMLPKSTITPVSDIELTRKNSDNDLPPSQTVAPIGQMIRAGLNDDSDEDEPFMNTKTNRSAGLDVAVGQVTEAITPPPRSPLRKVSSDSVSGFRSIDETKAHIQSDSLAGPQREIHTSHHSPGLGSISSEDDATSRVHSTHTERESYASSISDYGDVEDTKTADKIHSIPPSPSEASVQTSSLAASSGGPVGGAT